MQGAYTEARLAHGKRKGERQAQPPERAGQDKVRTLRHPQNRSRQVRKLERTCRQPETSWCGSAFQAQGADGRNTRCSVHQERLPIQRLQGGQAF